MSYITKPTPDILRQMEGLMALGNPKDAPDWITPAYIADCMQDEQTQRNWRPKVGDWYLCTDLFQVLRIDSLEKYLSVGQASLPSDLSIGGIFNGGCDVHIPNPKDLEGRTK